MTKQAVRMQELPPEEFEEFVREFIPDNLTMSVEEIEAALAVFRSRLATATHPDYIRELQYWIDYNLALLRRALNRARNTQPL